MSTQRFEITDDTPIAMLTVGQLKEVLRVETMMGIEGMIKPLEEKLMATRVTDEASGVRKTERYEDVDFIRGIGGICRFFKVKETTAWRLKEGVLKPAVTKKGKLILVDKQKAIELLKAYKEE